MNNEEYINKSDAPVTQEEEVVRKYQIHGSPSQTEFAEPKDKEEQEKQEILPGDVHSALGLHDPSNGGVQLEGAVKTEVNLNNRRDPNFPDRPAGWPVFKQVREEK